MTNRPQAIHHVDLLSKSAPTSNPGAANANAPPASVLREALFSAARLRLMPRLESCHTAVAWAALVRYGRPLNASTLACRPDAWPSHGLSLALWWQVRAVSVELGRINELCSEVEYLASRVPLTAHALPDAGEHRLTRGYPHTLPLADVMHHRDAHSGLPSPWRTLPSPHHFPVRATCQAA